MTSPPPADDEDAAGDGRRLQLGDAGAQRLGGLQQALRPVHEPLRGRLFGDVRPCQRPIRADHDDIPHLRRDLLQIGDCLGRVHRAEHTAAE